MYNSPFLSTKISEAFLEFTRDMRILPESIPLILASINGQIKKTKNLPSYFKTPFPTLAKFIDKEDFPLCFNELSKKGVCIARTSRDKKCFLVISLYDSFLLRCIGASFSENGALTLDDYLLKLCSYKDYLDSFERLHYDTENSLPFIKMLKSRISGASSIIEISNTQIEDTSKKKLLAQDLLKLLCSFIKLTDAPLEINVNADCKDNGCGIYVSQSFLKLCVSCLGLVIKNSKFASIKLSTLEKDGFVYLEMSTQSKNSKDGSVYENAVLRALDLCGYDFIFNTQNKIYSITFKLKSVPKTELIISDAKQDEQYFSRLLSQDELQNIFFSTGDFVF